MNQKKIGILGGMWPDATLFTYAEIIKSNKIRNPGKPTPHIIINSLPYDNIFENLGNTVFNAIMNGIIDLVKVGVNIIGISCNTAHLYINQFRNNMKDVEQFRNNLQRILNIKFIHLIDEAATYCYHKGYSSIGLASTPTSKELYKDAFAKYGIKCIYPNEIEQNEINILINNVLQHTNIESDRQKMNHISTRLLNAGAEQVILGCTELPLLFKDSEPPVSCISSISILASALLDHIQPNNIEG